MNASLGSVDFITSFCQSEDESKKIKEAVNTSSYGSEYVQAALSVNKKVSYTSFMGGGAYCFEHVRSAKTSPA